MLIFSLKELKALGSGAAYLQIEQASKFLYSFQKPTHLSADTEVLLEEYLNIHKPITKATIGLFCGQSSKNSLR